MKRILSVTLVIILVALCTFALSSCGGNDDSTTTAPPDENEPFDKSISYSKVVYGDIDYEAFNKMPTKLQIMEKSKSASRTKFETFYNKNGQIVKIRVSPLLRTINVISLGGSNGNIRPTSFSDYEYNEKGYITKIMSSNGSEGVLEYDKNDNLTVIKTNGITVTKYEYNEKNLCAKQYTYDSFSGNLISLYEYEYDANNNIIKITNSSEDGSSYETREFKYNTSGLITEEKIEQVRGGQVWFGYRTVYEYDTDGNKIKETNYDEDGAPDGYNTFEYANGNCIKTTNYERDGAKAYYSIYEYAGDVLVKESHFSREGSLDTYFEYTEEGLLIKEYSYFENGIAVRGTEYTYDSNGNLIKAFNIEENTSFEFQYDSKENLVKGFVYLNGNKVATAEYTYTDNACTNSKIYSGNGSVIKELNSEIALDINVNRTNSTIFISYSLENGNYVNEEYYLETYTIYSYHEMDNNLNRIKSIRYSKTGEITYEFDYVTQN